MQNDKYKQLIEVLREIFQLNQPDLDFGIYRIMNQKSAEIDDFLENRLIPQVKTIIEEANLGDSATIAKELEEVIANLIKYKVNPDTNEEVIRLRHELAQTPSSDGLQKEVFSALATFFQRYYDNGDFISKRRYRSNDTYAIPYNGEEVKLYWANHDQYYIKTSEYLKNYAFKIPHKDKKVRFELVEATTEKDNNKETNGKERRFKIETEKPLEVQGNELIIYFTYLPNETGEKQADLNEAAFEVIKNNLHKDWKGDILIKAPTEANKDRTLIEKHINDFTARNTFDYFIHKDIGTFLRRELDFFIKNEILFLEDIDLKNPKKYLAQLTKMNAIRKVANKVIIFLEQLENFQKKLWLKKKFVVETNYCITLDKIPESYYPEIAENEAQWTAWEALFAISEINKDELSGAEIPRLEFMKHQPFLVLDTQYFSTDFKDRLLAEFEDLEAETDGLLINSENFQALNLLQERYKEEVKCIHIDPPYNTDTSGFVYKNNFRHSSWMSMMIDRLLLASKILKEEGTFFCHIDHNEYENLFKISKTLGLVNQGTIIWDKRTPAPGSSTLARQHEYIITLSKGSVKLRTKKENGKVILKKAEYFIKKYGGVNENSRKSFKSWVKKQPDFTGGEKAYCDIDDDGRVFRPVHLGASEQRTDPKYFIPFIHPISKKPCPIPSRGWTGEPSFMNGLLENNLIIFGRDETIQPQRKYFMETQQFGELTTLIQSGQKGKKTTDALGIDFPYCHAVELYEGLNWTGTYNDKNSILIDFFAGSGTNGHAIINLNREDNGNRKYILVEMGEYFNTVTKPRIEKVIYSENWKDGKPTDRKGSSHLFKYIRLESYEDTLNNLRLQRTENQQGLLNLDNNLYEEYLLSYALDVESRGSLLSVGDFQNPYDYQLNITADNETSLTKIDLVETFNYLIGLKVQQIQTESGFKTVKGTNKKGQSVLVIWRNQTENDNEALAEFFQANNWHKGNNGFDLIYINGSNTVEMHKEAGTTWKILSTEEAFTRLMFDVKEV